MTSLLAENVSVNAALDWDQSTRPIDWSQTFNKQMKHSAIIMIARHPKSVVVPSRRSCRIQLTPSVVVCRFCSDSASKPNGPPNCV